MLVRINELEVIYREKEQIELEPFASPLNVVSYLKGAFEPYLDQESFWVILLNGANLPYARKMLTLGIQNQVQINPLLVFRYAIKEGANSIILAHNHPSGGLNPSPEDLNTTKRLLEGSKILEIPILDHIIVCPGLGWASIKATNPLLF